jgi:hypothetical protein
MQQLKLDLLEVIVIGDGWLFNKIYAGALVTQTCKGVVQQNIVEYSESFSNFLIYAIKS